jgi:co-chaperonin GroES (HSP10)
MDMGQMVTRLEDSLGRVFGNKCFDIEYCPNDDAFHVTRTHDGKSFMVYVCNLRSNDNETDAIMRQAFVCKDVCPIEAAPCQIVLKVLEGKSYSGSIALPDSAKEESDFCEVVSSKSETFLVGDTVLRPDPAEVEYKDEETGDVYLIVPEASIVAWKRGGRCAKTNQTGS